MCVNKSKLRMSWGLSSMLIHTKMTFKAIIREKRVMEIHFWHIWCNFNNISEEAGQLTSYTIEQHVNRSYAWSQYRASFLFPMFEFSYFLQWICTTVNVINISCHQQLLPLLAISSFIQPKTCCKPNFRINALRRICSECECSYLSLWKSGRTPWRKGKLSLEGWTVMGEAVG